MDLPDASRERNRGLPPDDDRPSIRLLRPSAPNNDLEYDESLDAFVAIKDVAREPLPASPGTATPQEGGEPRVPLHGDMYQCR